MVRLFGKSRSCRSRVLHDNVDSKLKMSNKTEQCQNYGCVCNREIKFRTDKTGKRFQGKSGGKRGAIDKKLIKRLNFID